MGLRYLSFNPFPSIFLKYPWCYFSIKEQKQFSSWGVFASDILLSLSCCFRHVCIWTGRVFNSLEHYYIHKLLCAVVGRGMKIIMFVLLNVLMSRPSSGISEHYMNYNEFRSSRGIDSGMCVYVWFRLHILYLGTMESPPLSVVGSSSKMEEISMPSGTGTRVYMIFSCGARRRPRSASLSASS